jgi:hypothetical protein
VAGDFAPAYAYRTVGYWVAAPFGTPGTVPARRSFSFKLAGAVPGAPFRQTMPLFFCRAFSGKWL